MVFFSLNGNFCSFIFLFFPMKAIFFIFPSKCQKMISFCHTKCGVQNFPICLVVWYDILRWRLWISNFLTTFFPPGQLPKLSCPRAENNSFLTEEFAYLRTPNPNLNVPAYNLHFCLIFALMEHWNAGVREKFQKITPYMVDSIKYSIGSSFFPARATEFWDLAPGNFHYQSSPIHPSFRPTFPKYRERSRR